MVKNCIWLHYSIAISAQHIISNATKIETKASNAINISNAKQETPQSFSSISLFMKNGKKKVKRRIKI